MRSFQKTANRVLRTLVCTVIVVAVMAVSLCALSGLFIPKNNQKAFGMMNQEANGILGEPENTIDVLFIGDSEAFSAFSPMQMWNEQGFTSYVCATSQQQLPYGNTLLHRATQNQKPKVVVIETNTIYAPFSIDVAVLRTAQDILPVLEYHDRWKSATAADATTEPQATWTDDLKGFYIYKGVSPTDAAGHMAPSDEVQQIPILNQQYLQMMISYCRSIGATPVLVSTPSTLCWNTARHNGIAKFAESAGVDYIDLNVEPTKVPIDWQTDTRDAGDHVNYAGAVKVSSFIGKYLGETYNLPNHKGDEAYRSWNEAFTRYESRIQE